MRLATVKTLAGPRLAAAHQGDDGLRLIDLHPADSSLPATVKELLALEDGIARAAAALERAARDSTYLDAPLLAPVPDPGKVICIGLNYRDHAIETGSEIPSEPVVFSKFASAVVGPEDAIRLPRVCKKVDYEAELVAVIGRRGRNIAEGDALSHVAGYMNGNDVSARDWQKGRPGGQWLLGKTPDTFAPTGPWLVTADEVATPNSLGVKLRLNGETMQDSSTSQFIFRLETIIAHVSQLVTLEPGDLIFTGTPPGVGVARKPPVFLKPGDVVEVEVEGLGVLRNRVEGE